MKHRVLRAPALLVVLWSLLTLFCSEDPAGPDDLREELQPHGSIAGVVCNTRGEPLRGVLVAANADSSIPDVSDSLGQFTIGYVGRGTHTLRFTHRDWENSAVTVTVGEGEDVVLDDTVRLSSAWYVLTGRVVYGQGSPVPGAGVAVVGAGMSTLTGPDGSFSLPGVPKLPSIELISAKTGIGFTTKSVMNLLSDDTTRVGDVVLSEEGATVTGVVYDTAGVPLPNVVVISVGGGLVDTTDADGVYILENVPGTAGGVAIQVSGDHGSSGALTGIDAANGALIAGADIHLGAAADTANGMKLDASSVVARGSADSITVWINATSAEDVVIAGFEWFIDDTTTTATQTARASCTFPRSAFPPHVAGGPDRIETAVWVRARATSGVLSAFARIRMTIHRDTPVAEAAGAVHRDSVFGDTVRIHAGTFAVLRGNATDLFGGLDSLVWDFGDSTPPWVSTDSLALVQHLYEAEGTYLAVFRAVDTDNNQARDTVTVEVTGSPIDAPVYVSPADNDTNRTASDSVTFVWRPVDGAGVTYNLYLDRLNNPPTTCAVPATSDTIAQARVDSGRTYFWRVEAVSATARASGPVRTFTGRQATQPVSTDILLQPVDGTVVDGWDVTLVWRRVPGYAFRALVGADSSALAPLGVFAADTAALLSKRPGNSTIYWRVDMRDSTGEVTRSAVWSFRTPNHVPETPVLLSPDSAAVVSQGSPTFTWSCTDADASDTLRYTVYLDADLNPPVTAVATGIQATSFTCTTCILDTGHTYYWRVYATDGHTGGERFSAVREFSLSRAPANGLVAWYPLDGNADDFSGYGNDGVLNGPAPATDRFGRNGHAYSFNGVSDHIHCGADTAVNSKDALTVSVWFKTSTPHHGGFIVSKSSTTVQCWSVVVLTRDYGDRIRLLEVQDTLGRYTDRVADYSTTFYDDRWHHITSTFDGARVKGYYDGTLVLDTAWSLPIAAGNPPLIIGSGYDFTPSFNGLIDDVRVYNRPLSETEVQALYGEGGYLPPLDAPRLSAWGVDSTTIHVEWTLPPDALGFRLQQSASRTGPFSACAEGPYTTTHMNHSPLTPGRQVYYRVQATDDPRFSAWSDTVGAVASALPAGGLIAYYPFNGNAADESGNGYSGQAMGGAQLTEDRFGDTTAAYLLDGVDSYIETDSLVLPFHHEIALKESDSRLLLGDSLSGLSASTALPSNAWTFVTSVYDAAEHEKRLYIDGTLAASEPTSIDMGASIAAWVYYNGLSGVNGWQVVISQMISSHNSVPRSFKIGWNGYHNVDNDDMYFNGKVDDIRVYDRALNEDEVLQLYHENGWTGQ